MILYSRLTRPFTILFLIFGQNGVKIYFSTPVVDFYFTSLCGMKSQREYQLLCENTKLVMRGSGVRPFFRFIVEPCDVFLIAWNCM